MTIRRTAILLSLSFLLGLSCQAGWGAGSPAKKPVPANTKPALAALSKAAAPGGAKPAPAKASLAPEAADSDKNAVESKPNSVSQSDNKPTLLKGRLEEQISPFAADGHKETLTEGTKVTMTLAANINSELSKKGDEVIAMVSVDLKDKDKVLLPGKWFFHGTVADVASSRRMGRNGFITIKFDHLISPDGRFVVPVEAEVTTRDSTSKAVAKTVAVDSVYVARGAAKGAWRSLLVTGVPVAVASHGYSVAGGAAIGASFGLYKALRRMGKIACVTPGDDIELRLSKQIELPAFNPEGLPSATPPPKLENFDFIVKQHSFEPDPSGDKLSSLLKVDFAMDNQTDKPYSFDNVAVVSDRDRLYTPYALAFNQNSHVHSVPAKSIQKGQITFAVGSPKRKYFLVLLDSSHQHELARTPIN